MRVRVTKLALLGTCVTLVAAGIAIAKPVKGAWTGAVQFNVAGKNANKIKQLRDGADFAVNCGGAILADDFTQKGKVRIKNNRFVYRDPEFDSSVRRRRAVGYALKIKVDFVSNQAAEGTYEVKATDGSCTSGKIPFTSEPV